MFVKALTCACVLGLTLCSGCGKSGNAAPAGKLTPASFQKGDFKKIDANQDGVISYDEFDVVTDNKGDAVGNAVYVQIDKDGNGKITAEEFKTEVIAAPAPVAAPAEEKAPAAKPADAK